VAAAHANAAYQVINRNTLREPQDLVEREGRASVVRLLHAQRLHAQQVLIPKLLLETLNVAYGQKHRNEVCRVMPCGRSETDLGNWETGTQDFVFYRSSSAIPANQLVLLPQSLHNSTNL
jgi:hypothetical protein